MLIRDDGIQENIQRYAALIEWLEYQYLYTYKPDTLVYNYEFAFSPAAYNCNVKIYSFIISCNDLYKMEFLDFFPSELYRIQNSFYFKNAFHYFPRNLKPFYL